MKDEKKIAGERRLPKGNDPHHKIFYVDEVGFEKISHRKSGRADKKKEAQDEIVLVRDIFCSGCKPHSHNIKQRKGQYISGYNA